MISKGDFVELEFTAAVDGEIFDTTDAEIAKSLGYKKEVKPIKIVVGEGMVVRGLDEALLAKEIGKEYEVVLKPNEAFGERRQELIKTFSVNAFKDRRMLKEGNMLFIEGVLAKVVKVASGRVMLDFNHPLAGKEVQYKFKIIRKIEDLGEKVAAILDYYGIKDYKIETNDKKVVVKVKNNAFQLKTLLGRFFPENVEVMQEQEEGAREATETTEARETKKNTG
jgi:FKBP-type peptidyl-prolyl cis-trans isomerase 2